MKFESGLGRRRLLAGSVSWDELSSQDQLPSRVPHGPWGIALRQSVGRGTARFSSLVVFSRGDGSASRSMQSAESGNSTFGHGAAATTEFSPRLA